jgi:DNA-binding NarL/FixJ family response regulator
VSAFRGCASALETSPEVKVSVVTHGDLPVDQLLGRLRADPDILLLDGAARPDADIVLVLASVADEELPALLSMLSAQAVNPAQRTVLVSEPLRERHVALAFGAGVVSILPRREATDSLIARTVVSSARGHAVLPSTLTRWLVDEARMLTQTMVHARGLQTGGLTEREVAVFRLLADGHETASIADKLSYSERTIKQVVQNAIRRFGFRNRVQVVAYAMRIGAI